MKRIFEKIVEGLLACSGFVTSITIVLIVLFLFSEAAGLFGDKVIEEGYVLAVHQGTGVDELTPEEIKDVFDGEITNWKDVGGEDVPIRLFRLEDAERYFTEEQLGASYENAGACITGLVARTPGMVAFVPEQFVEHNDSVYLMKDNTISAKDVFAGAEWFPTATPAPLFGFLPLITGTLWVGGEDVPIRLFRLEDAERYFTEEQLGASYENAGACITGLVARTPGMVAFVPEQFVEHNDSVYLMKDNTISAKDVFAGAEWFPTATPAPLFGFLPLITGTLWVSLFAILIALPFGLSVAIYMSEVAHPKIRNVLKPVIELLSGIPSVVYGFFGLIVIVPLLQQVFNLPVGESGLAGSIVLAIMALPTIITVTEDAMRNCPRAMREASLALGASQWQTIYRVVIPYSISGITSGVVLGIGRAVGETMAVLMVTGNAAVIPSSILEPLRTIPATIAAELGEAPAGGAHYASLFLLGVVLFFISLLINFTVEAVSKRK